MSTFLKTFFLLVMGHFLCDYVLQPTDIALGKNRNQYYPLHKIVPWYWWMTSHCACHSLAVFALTGSTLLALMEFLWHFAIDAAKCEKYTNLNQDQLLHVICKAVWASIVVFCF